MSGSACQFLGELWSGVECSQSRESNLKKLQHGVSKLINWPFDEAAAMEFGRIYAQLRQMGRPMQQIDIQIAAIAISLGNCVVVSTDSDLQAIPGLKTADWSSH